MFEEFIPPTPADSDDYKPRDNFGHLAIVKPTEHRDEVQTVNGPASAVFADIHDIDDGQTYRNVMLMGGAFVDAFKPYLGKLIVVTWQKATSRAGRPYAIPTAATPEQIQRATAVMAKGDPFVSAVTTIDAERPF